MIKLKNISKFYSKNQTVSLGLRKVNLELGLHEFVAIVGESGSGKTTLLNVISGIDTYEEGELYINDEETSYYSKEDWENYRKKYIAFIFQSYNLIESYTVLQNVEAALILSGYPKDKLRQRALDIIGKVGLSDHIKHKATKLSGGQKQRVVIARAIAKDAPVVVADEPTGNLDSESAKMIINLLAEIAKEKLVIVVTHDFSQVEEVATRKIRVFDGEIVEDKKIVKVVPEKLPILEDKDYKMNFKETTKMVLRNLLATPKKSLLLFVIFAFAIFFFAFAYATFLDSRSGLTGQNYDFGFIPETRIVLNKTDGSPFTESEITDFENHSKVNTVVPFDFLMTNSYGDYEWEIKMSNNIYDREYMNLMILPISLLGDEYQNWNINEVLLTLPNYYEDEALSNFLGKEATLKFFTKSYNFDINKVIYTNDIINVVDEEYRSYVFIHDDRWDYFGKLFGFNNYATIKIDKSGSSIDLSDYWVSLASDLNDDEMYIYYDFENTSDYQADIMFETFYTNKTIENVTVRPKVMSQYEIQLSQNLFDQIFDENVPYQISIFANDPIEASQLYEDLSREKENGVNLYQVYYPANVNSGESLEGLILIVLNFGLFVMFGLMFLAIYFISYVIIKNIINSKMTDYAIFRTIGANKGTIRSFIYLESWFMAAFAYIIFLLLVIFISPFVEVGSPLFILKYFDFKNLLYLLLFVSFFAVILSRRYLSRVYHDSVAETLRREME
ncbi:ABC transporter ATP-binding protein/permease [Hujiaoplasma nucleasis]|uniref:ABC transporter ATP-binding protein/permease n=1 Tax=Hujiaoplasma nucleasis TaxID=2725268 RepID=A0A7L6N490_9MOLU|nr:ABC transporter ATP-binding protein/permease [Hujiaoplasma nucleasis]QLY40312.1 ABC transporter ATP-binding protein/permease [Hujiaoplasma nucleasis]